jgi:hypothetical protein
MQYNNNNNNSGMNNIEMEHRSSSNSSYPKIDNIIGGMNESILL